MQRTHPKVSISSAVERFAGSRNCYCCSPPPQR